eukprot:maker-scaffold101_size371023-snap-gene-0.22 protein:Tk03054 transcript:maker-scaffold101_size371023-snap-gene-0.22-mRNA-1 annotation:"unknown"
MTFPSLVMSPKTMILAGNLVFITGAINGEIRLVGEELDDARVDLAQPSELLASLQPGGSSLTALITVLRPTDLLAACTFMETPGLSLMDLFKPARKRGTQNNTFHHPGFQAIYQNQPDFDVIFATVIGLDFGYYFVKEVLSTPSILFLPMSRAPFADYFMGNPLDPSYVNLEFLPYSQCMSFKERVVNFLVTHISARALSYLVFPYLEQQASDLTQGNYSQINLHKAAMDMNFGFFNTHPIIDGVRPVNPNTAFVGGLHVNPGQALPQDLQDWIDQAEHGVIYVSFGSVLSGSKMPPHVLERFIGAFSRLKQRIIFKWETEQMVGKPENVLLQKWCPQQDILAHPNVKLFITHGGLLSTEEAIYHGTPLLYIPGYADQPATAHHGVSRGYALQLQWLTFTDSTLEATIVEMLTNPSYTETIQHYGELFRDNPISNLEKAVFHTEYIMRHRGAPHLKPVHDHLSVMEYHSVDVVAFLLTLLLGSLYLICKLLAWLCRRVIWAPKQKQL